MTPPGEGLERILVSESAIAARLPELARAIANGIFKPDIVAPVLTGAFVFAADLLRALAREGHDLPTDFLWLRAYGGALSPGDVTVLRGPSEAVRGKNVLLIDGVLDSGITLLRAKQLLLEAGAKAVVTTVIISKQHPTRGFEADHAGFQAGAEFLYGYGMDATGGTGRGLSDIRVR